MQLYYQPMLMSAWREKACLFQTVDSENSVVPPTILRPGIGTIDVPTSVTIVWRSVENAVSYDLQVSEEDLCFLTLELIILDESGLSDTSWILSDLKLDTEYWVRVRARTADSVSVWSSRFTSHSFRTVVVGVGDEPAASRAIRMNITPHPASNFARILISGLPNNVESHIALYDIMGVEIASFQSRDTPETDITFDLSGAPSGIYFLQLVSDGTTHTQRLCVVK